MMFGLGALGTGAFCGIPVQATVMPSVPFGASPCQGAAADVVAEVAMDIVTWTTVDIVTEARRVECC